MSTIPGLLLLIFFLIGIAGTVFWIIALVDALRFSDTEWTAADQNKLVYVLVLIFLGIIGALVYWFVARPELVKRLVTHLEGTPGSTVAVVDGFLFCLEMVPKDPRLNLLLEFGDAETFNWTG